MTTAIQRPSLNRRNRGIVEEERRALGLEPPPPPRKRRASASSSLAPDATTTSTSTATSRTRVLDVDLAIKTLERERKWRELATDILANLAILILLLVYVFSSRWITNGFWAGESINSDLSWRLFANDYTTYLPRWALDAGFAAVANCSASAGESGAVEEETCRLPFRTDASFKTIRDVPSFNQWMIDFIDHSRLLRADQTRVDGLTLLGTMRLRQVRVPTECSGGGDFALSLGNRSTCYPLYDPERQFEGNITLLPGSSLPQHLVGALAFTTASEASSTRLAPDLEVNVPDLSPARIPSDKLAVEYDRGGYIWDLPKCDPLKARVEAAALLSGGWISPFSTSAVFLSFTVYDAISGALVFVRYSLEFFPTGSVLPVRDARVFRIPGGADDPSSDLRYALAAISLFYLLLYLVKVGRKIYFVVSDWSAASSSTRASSTTSPDRMNQIANTSNEVSRPMNRHGDASSSSSSDTHHRHHQAPPISLGGDEGLMPGGEGVVSAMARDVEESRARKAGIVWDLFDVAAMALVQGAVWTAISTGRDAHVLALDTPRAFGLLSACNCSAHAAYFEQISYFTRTEDILLGFSFLAVAIRFLQLCGYYTRLSFQYAVLTRMRCQIAAWTALGASLLFFFALGGAFLFGESLVHFQTVWDAVVTTFLISSGLDAGAPFYDEGAITGTRVTRQVTTNSLPPVTKVDWATLERKLGTRVTVADAVAISSPYAVNALVSYPLWIGLLIVAVFWVLRNLLLGIVLQGGERVAMDIREGEADARERNEIEGKTGIWSRGRRALFGWRHHYALGRFLRALRSHHELLERGFATREETNEVIVNDLARASLLRRCCGSSPSDGSSNPNPVFARALFEEVFGRFSVELESVDEAILILRQEEEKCGDGATRRPEGVLRHHTSKEEEKMRNGSGEYDDEDGDERLLAKRLSGGVTVAAEEEEEEFDPRAHVRWERLIRTGDLAQSLALVHGLRSKRRFTLLSARLAALDKRQSEVAHAVRRAFDEMRRERLNRVGMMDGKPGAGEANDDDLEGVWKRKRGSHGIETVGDTFHVHHTTETGKYRFVGVFKERAEAERAFVAVSKLARVLDARRATKRGGLEGEETMFDEDEEDEEDEDAITGKDHASRKRENAEEALDEGDHDLTRRKEREKARRRRIALKRGQLSQLLSEEEEEEEEEEEGRRAEQNQEEKMAGNRQGRVVNPEDERREGATEIERDDGNKKPPKSTNTSSFVTTPPPNTSDSHPSPSSGSQLVSSFVATASSWVKAGGAWVWGGLETAARWLFMPVAEAETLSLDATGAWKDDEGRTVSLKRPRSVVPLASLRYENLKNST